MPNKLSFVAPIILLFSCSTSKDIVYFREFEKNMSIEEKDISHPRIKKNDILMINVKTESPEIISVFEKNESSGTNVNSLLFQGYLVDYNGNITLPTLGKLKVVGLTTLELSEKIEKKMLEYVYDLVVTVRIANQKVTVLGEVNNPGTFYINEERLNILQLIGLAGDLTTFAKRNEILLIRNKNSQKEVFELDITDVSLFSSPAFYVEQNDIIYIKPNRRKIISSGIINDPFKISSIVALILTLYNNFL